MIGQSHTEECRARITARMENDLAHAKRIEDNLNKRNEFANPETIVAVLSESRKDATKRARQDDLETPQESANTGGASSSSAGADVDVRVIHADKRQLDSGGDKDMVCGLGVCVWRTILHTRNVSKTLTRRTDPPLQSRELLHQVSTAQM